MIEFNRDESGAYQLALVCLFIYNYKILSKFNKDIKEQFVVCGDKNKEIK